jgi:hypothetical protein
MLLRRSTCLGLTDVKLAQRGGIANRLLRELYGRLLTMHELMPHADSDEIRSE